MERSTAFVLSLSILLPLIAGVVRFRNLRDSYLPVFYLLIIGLINELVCYLFFEHSSNAVPTNIYYLLEFLLFTWQFRKWKNILCRTWLYLSVIGVMSFVWIGENLIYGKIAEFSPLFQIGYSFVLILLAVNQLNWLIVNEKGNIMRHPVFIICIAMIIYFSYKVLTETFYYYAPENLIKRNIFVLQSYLNVGYNIMLGIALLCIPRKKAFIQPLQ
jgi:hypothetical protein